MFCVDCQSHFFPKSYAEVIKKNRGFVQAQNDGENCIISYGNLQKFKLNFEKYDPEKKIRDMDSSKIDVSVLSINIPGPELLAPELGIEGARICNDYVAELCERYRGRFVGLAVLPLQDIPSALEEFDRAISQLKLRGFVLYSHINGKPVDSPELEPVYKKAEELKVPVVLHPTIPVWGEVIKEYSMIPMLGLMVDTSIAMLRLILSGILERYPNLLVVHPHCGGVLPYLMPRIQEQTEVKKRGREYIKKAPMEYYKKVYIDLVSPSTLAMQYVYDFFGSDNLLFATDHPWVRVEMIKKCLDNLKIPSEEKAHILGLNACKLFKI